jgi:hypothetical protein
MAALVIVLVLFISGLVGYLVWASCQADDNRRTLDEAPPTPEELMQIRVDRHRIQRRLDVRLAKQAQQREATRVKEAIAEAMEDDQP